MNFSKTTLSNGLRVITVPMPSLESSTVCVWIRTGSRNEEKRINGISHFLEHMTFKGSKKRPSAKQISEAVDAIGAEFNAATSKEWTNFYIKTPSGNLETAFDVLSDMVLNPLLKKEEIEREKGVIIEEINMYEDTPMMKIGDVFENLIFSEDSLGRDISGTVKSVKSIQRDDFLSYRKRHYYADNVIVSVAGGVDEKKVIELAKKHFSDLSHIGSGPGQNASHPLGGPFQTGPQVKLHPKKKEQAHLILGFMADGRGYKGRYAQGVLATILGGGMSSRLFIEVRERRGLAYAVRTSVDRYVGTGYLGTYAGVDPKRIDEAIAVMLEEHYKLANSEKRIGKACRFAVAKSELTKAKEYLKGHLALALEDTHAVGDFFAEQELFLPKIETPEEVFKKVDKVSLDEILHEAKRLFVPSRLNLAVIGPYNDQSRFEKLLK